MKLTPFILLLPFLILSTVWFGRSFCIRFGAAMFIVWILSTIACFGWGVYISRQHRFLGWLCVAVGIVQIAILLMTGV
jgi:hypothetical protein